MLSAVNYILTMVATPSESWNTTESFTTWPCSSLPCVLSCYNDNTLLNGKLATKVKIKPLSTGLKQNLTPWAQAHCEVEVIVVENGTTTTEATTTILGTTITLIAISV